MLTKPVKWEMVRVWIQDDWKYNTLMQLSLLSLPLHGEKIYNIDKTAIQKGLSVKSAKHNLMPCFIYFKIFPFTYSNRILASFCFSDIRLWQAILRAVLNFFADSVKTSTEDGLPQLKPQHLEQDQTTDHNLPPGKMEQSQD